MTRSNSIMGTPCFMAPEQARQQSDRFDGRADIFSFGCILYFMLSGRLPFFGDRYSQVLLQIISEEPTPLRELQPDLPEAVEHVIHRSLCKEPDERYQSVELLVQALCEAAGMRWVARETGASGAPGSPSQKREHTPEMFAETLPPATGPTGPGGDPQEVVIPDTVPVAMIGQPGEDRRHKATKTGQDPEPAQPGGARPASLLESNPPANLHKLRTGPSRGLLFAAGGALLVVIVIAVWLARSHQGGSITPPPRIKQIPSAVTAAHGGSRSTAAVRKPDARAPGVVPETGNLRRARPDGPSHVRKAPGVKTAPRHSRRKRRRAAATKVSTPLTKKTSEPARTPEAAARDTRLPPEPKSAPAPEDDQLQDPKF